VTTPEPGSQRTAIKDPKRIDVSDDREVAAWALLLQVSIRTLLDAVEAVGPMSTVVAIHLSACARSKRR
jgi:hypothetical protein